MAKQNKTRKKADDNIRQGAIINNSVDLATLKRIYPKRFLADIVEKEGYVEVSRGKWQKKTD